jgi:cobalt-zinc-cadmium efflux system membrane fusion protein
MWVGDCSLDVAARVSYQGAVRRVKAICAVVCVCLIAACGGAEDTASAAAVSTRDVPVFEGGVVKFSQRFAERVGYRTEEVSPQPIVPVLHVTGLLEFDERRLAAVGSRIAGRVSEVHVVDGAEIEPGEVLASLESAELGEAQAEIFAIRARAQAATSNVSRKKQLVSEGIASLRSAEVASQEADVADAELMAARHRVQALVGNEDGLRAKNSRLGLLSLRAPIGGRIVGVHVFRGQAVEPSHTAFTIADPSQLWVRLAVFEGELKNLREGDEVEIESQADPSVRLSGAVAFISPTLDPSTMAAEVRVVVPNPDGKLRAGQAVNAHILTAADRRTALSVPRQALVQVDGQPTIFVETGERQVAPRPVTLGVQGMKRVEIVSGLELGERVVVDGVFAIKSELFR